MSEMTPSSADVTKTNLSSTSVENATLESIMKQKYPLSDLILRKLRLGIIFIVLSSLLLVWMRGGYPGDSLGYTLLNLSFVFFGYLLPLSVLSDLLLQWLSRFSLVSRFHLFLSLLLYLLIILSFWNFYYEGEKLTFTVFTLVALVCWGLEEWTQRDEKVSQWFLRIPDQVKKIALIPTVLLSVVFGLISVLLLLMSLVTRDKQTLYEEIPSPDGAYTIQVYELQGGPCNDYSTVVTFNNELRDSKRIDWQTCDYPTVKTYDHPTVKWIDKQTVEINGHKLNVLKDEYREPKQ